MTAIKGYLVVLVPVMGAASAQAELICSAQKPGIVMKTGKSGEFYSLMDKKMTEEAARCCVSCIVDPGTKVIITNQGFASHTIRVIEGQSRGCVGDMPREWVKDCK
jgi:hypothetical protein